ncbi:hypothetical protein F0562_008806 [Nyssa sinensis]|uniref:SHSP domain-containing protein n=1 Tax=Nyssa sinensis TaxID=561372 RepID=A0A5J5A785_9ASTE|nr:hypothetical protein F0562_008806 [Nyssa sinensis]
MLRSYPSDTRDDWKETRNAYVFRDGFPGLKLKENEVKCKCKWKKDGVLTVTVPEMEVKKPHLEKEILTKLNGSSTQPAPQPFTSRLVYPLVNPAGGSDIFPGTPPQTYPARGDCGAGGSMFASLNHPMFGGIGRGSSIPRRQLGFPLVIPRAARFVPHVPTSFS